MSKSKSIEVVNQETGEIRVVRGVGARSMTPPKRETVTPINQVAGDNPPAVNLRDHPEFAGMELTIMDARFADSNLGGKKGTYLVAACYMTAPGEEAKETDFVIIMTGSENVQGRVAEAMLATENPFPISGILRLSGGGRAWFLD